jgi:hypothetical protein
VLFPNTLFLLGIEGLEWNGYIGDHKHNRYRVAVAFLDDSGRPLVPQDHDEVFS